MEKMKNFSGAVLFLDRSDINTDEIIPAKYLTEISKEALKPYLFEDIKLDGFNPNDDIVGKNIIVSRSNFGCGASREHAPWVLEANGIHVVIAERFARIFRQNMFKCGMLAVELPEAVIEHIIKDYSNTQTSISTDLKQNVFRIESDGQSEDIPFSISKFDRTLVTAGGWLEYADSKY
jgi:3-isopropylmalate/(R)-2-methylmalate dehydratase small subunit